MLRGWVAENTSAATKFNLYACDVATALCAEREPEAAGVGVHFDQPLGRAQGDQDRERLVKLLDEIERFTAQRVEAL